jgi:hypothetical protein
MARGAGLYRMGRVTTFKRITIDFSQNPFFTIRVGPIALDGTDRQTLLVFNADGDIAQIHLARFSICKIKRGIILTWVRRRGQHITNKIRHS